MGHVKQLDEAITNLIQEHQLILSVPGVGPVLGAAILGEIGDIRRFENAKKLRAYAGLDATVYQSGSFEGSRAHLSKRGSPHLRRALWITAGTARLRDPALKAYYERLIARGKHPKQAQAAVASKLCSVIFAVLSKNQPYNPEYLNKNPTRHLLVCLKVDGLVTNPNLELLLAAPPKLLRERLVSSSAGFAMLLPLTGTILDMGCTLNRMKPLLVEIAFQAIPYKG